MSDLTLDEIASSIRHHDYEYVAEEDELAKLGYEIVEIGSEIRNGEDGWTVDYIVKFNNRFYLFVYYGNSWNGPVVVFDREVFPKEVTRIEYE